MIIMLSIKARGSAREAEDYYTHLVTDHGPEDYYVAAGDSGSWSGAGADALGLAGGASAEQFRALAEGRDPRSGAALVQGAGEEHRAGWDLTFSAPKSVSVAWGTADGDQRQAIADAHKRAVDIAMQKVIEDHAAYGRRGKGGMHHERVSLVAAQFVHGTSREQDPQLHTHSFVFNCAQRADGTWGGVESSYMYRWKMAAGTVYRAELAAQLQKLGYEIERDGTSFRIVGVSQEISDHFSKRRAQIEAALAEHGTSGARASEVAALDTRRDKEHADRDELRQRWQTEAAERGLDAEAIAALSDHEREIEREPMPEPVDMLRTATAQRGVLTEPQLWAAVAVEAQGRTDAQGVADYMTQLMESPELVRLTASDGSTRYTSRELYQVERRIVSQARERATETRHAVPASRVDEAMAAFQAQRGYALSPEQQAAVRHVTQQPGAVAVVVGDAGSGKSTMLDAANRAWVADGYRVSGCALAGKAAAGLEEGSGIRSGTIHSLLARLEPQDGKPPAVTLTARDILVIDEAGMVDSRLLGRLMDHAEAGGAKVVMVGDHKQLQSIGAGGVFRHLAANNAAHLTEVYRQREAWSRDAARQVAHGDAPTALAAYIERDQVHVADTHDQAIGQAVDRWWSHYDRARPGESLMLADLRADVRRLNDAARAQMRTAHQLGPAATIQTRDRDGNATGKIEIAEGDRILFRKNDRDLGVRNGDLATVERIQLGSDGYQISARLDRGGERVTIDPQAYAQIEHGYAVTVHASQGATVDHAVVLAGSSMTSRESTYVQLSRHRLSAEIVTTAARLDEAAATMGLDLDDDRDHAARLAELAEAMSASRAQESTLDFEAEAEHVIEPENDTKPAPAQDEEMELQ
ncbi:relaxase domain-containing protein [bacterium]|nr:relaxase domain-containing protein [bacterium]